MGAAKNEQGAPNGNVTPLIMGSIILIILCLQFAVLTMPYIRVKFHNHRT